MVPATSAGAKNVRIIAVALVVAAGVAFLPFWPALLLAGWTGTLARPMLRRIAPVVRGRERAAAVVTALLVVVCFIPIVGLVFAAANEAAELYHRLHESGADRSVLTALVAPEGQNGVVHEQEIRFGAQEIATLVKSYGERAWSVAVALAGTATSVLIGIVIFFWGTYATLCSGPRAYAWFESHAELPPIVTRRFHEAFVETGRGLLFGVGATSFVQAAVATITYMVLGIPRALLLGFVTLLVSIIPALGSGFVWVPIAIGLALSGEVTKAIALTVIGLFVIGTVDNVVRPYFARYADLKMSSFGLFVSMLGGLAVVGPFGILLGPLAVRMAREALELRKKLVVDDATAAPDLETIADSEPVSGRGDAAPRRPTSSMTTPLELARTRT